MHVNLALEKLLNATDAGRIILAFAIPSRVFRVTRDDSWLGFRVEQFNLANRDPMNPRGSWHTLSTHNGDQPGAMLQSAMVAMSKAQQHLAKKLRARKGLPPGESRIIRP